MPFILTIRERSHSWAGRPPVRSEHASRAGAQAELLDYVRRNWDAEMGTDAPGEPGKIIEEYFSEVLEGYDIVEAGITDEIIAHAFACISLEKFGDGRTAQVAVDEQRLGA